MSATNAIDFSSIGGKPVAGPIDFSSIGGKPVSEQPVAKRQWQTYQVPATKTESGGTMSAAVGSMEEKDFLARGAKPVLDARGNPAKPVTYTVGAEPGPATFSQQERDTERAAETEDFHKAIKTSGVILGSSLAPELLPEALSGGFSGVALRSLLAGGGAATGNAAGQTISGENPFTAQNLKESGSRGLEMGTLNLAGESVPYVLREALAGRSAAPAIAESGGIRNYLREKFVTPDAPQAPAPTPKPVSTPVKVETPLDDATIRQNLGGKSLSADARDTIRQYAGNTIPAGSSAKNELLKTVRPVNQTISEQGAKLDAILEKAPPLQQSIGETGASDAILNDLKHNLPGGTEKTLGAAMDKEFTRYEDLLNSRDPQAINKGIRDIDQRINSYRAPEQPIDTPNDAADAARVTIRRLLRTSLDTAIPETQPINDILGKNLEVRALLRKRFGTTALSPDAADAQYASELQKGQAQINNTNTYQQAKDAHDAQAAKVARNQKIALAVGSGAVGTVGGVLLRDWMKGGQ